MKSLALFSAAAALSALGAGAGAGCSSDDAPERCDPTAVGTLCTIAGDGKNGYAGDDGDARAARMSLPQDTIRIGEVLYILDWNNHRLRMLAPDGTMHHVAGRGELGGTLDDPANSDLNHPTGFVYDAARNRLLVAAWHNSKLRSLDLATHEIVDISGDGRRAYFGDGGPALTASLDLPASLAFSPAGDLVIMDQANQVLRRIDPAGNIHRLAGRCVVDAAPPNGGGACAPGVEPVACPAPSGKYTCGSMATCAAPCTPGYGGEDGPADLLRMSQPFGQSADPAGRIAFDAAGDLYFADTANALIRKIDAATGTVSRVAGRPPTAGVPDSGFNGDAMPALAAQLHNPVDLAFDTDGTLYFTDVYNHCVRALAPDGIIRTAAGRCGESGYAGDGEPAPQGLLKRPYGIELSDGVLYIADTGNNAIRSVVLR